MNWLIVPVVAIVLDILLFAAVAVFVEMIAGWEE